MARSMARQVLMQLLYERLSGGDAGDDSMVMALEMLPKKDDTVKAWLTKTDKEYIRESMIAIEEKQPELDQLIEEYSTGEWTMDRVANVDKAILRLAVYEMRMRDDVPHAVAISEAVELSRKYSEPKSTRYINGVLGAIERGNKEG